MKKLLIADDFSVITNAQKKMVEILKKDFIIQFGILGANKRQDPISPLGLKDKKELLKSVFGDDIEIIEIDDSPYENKLQKNLFKETEYYLNNSNPYYSDFFSKLNKKFKTNPITLNKKDFYSKINYIDYFIETSKEKLKFLLCKKSNLVFEKLKESKVFQVLMDDFKKNQEYQKIWAAAPYPVIFTTCDAVVVKDDKVMLIKRGHAPAKGSWAMAGGFLNHDEKIEDGIIRELKEETNITLTEEELKKCIVSKLNVFDLPLRSLRGRTITNTLLIDLTGVDFGFKKEGADDAVKAKFISIKKLKQNNMCEDHYFVVLKTIKKYKFKK